MNEEMKAGRELDALVAEKVMGWRREAYWQDGQEVSGLLGPGGIREVDQFPYYSTDISAAWEVVDKLNWLSIAIGRFCSSKTVSVSMWRPRTEWGAHPIEVWTESGTVPLAICLSALKAVTAAEVAQ